MAAQRQVSRKVHFHSPQTGVSLELPLGFERVGRDESSVTLALLSDEDEPRPDDPRVQVQVVGTLSGADTDTRERIVAELADGFERSGGELLGRSRGVIDGCLTERVRLRRDDGVLVDASALVGSQPDEARVLTVVSTARDPHWRDVVDEMLASVRVIENAEDPSPSADAWTTMTLADLGLSLEVPRDWELGGATEDSVTLLAANPGTDTARTVVAITSAVPGGSGHDWFADFAGQVAPVLEAEVEGLRLVSEDRFALSSMNADVVALVARHPVSGLGELARLQAWIWASSTRMYLVSGTLSVEQEAHDLPILDRILHSLRILATR